MSQKLKTTMKALRLAIRGGLEFKDNVVISYMPSGEAEDNANELARLKEKFPDLVIHFDQVADDYAEFSIEFPEDIYGEIPDGEYN
jgi:hypothetical protein